MGWLTYVVAFAFCAVVAYKIIGGGRPLTRSLPALLCALVGFLTFYQGFDLARREADRVRYGRGTQGIVIEKLGSGEVEQLQALERQRSAGQSFGRRPRRLSLPVGEGYALQQQLVRWIATGSPRAWMIAYRYDCNAPPCSGRDVVTEAMWSELQIGQAVNVREIVGEPHTAGLEDNSKWALAVTEMGLGAVWLLGARLLSGPLRRREWITAPAVVLRVEPVTYPDGTRWRIHFAYFDRRSQAQESADEVSANTWKAGDDCLAVFQPQAPDLATLRPLETNSPA